MRAEWVLRYNNLGFSRIQSRVATKLGDRHDTSGGVHLERELCGSGVSVGKMLMRITYQRVYGTHVTLFWRTK